MVVLNPFFSDPLSCLYHGHVLEVLAEMEKASVDVVCTSPPYWSQRVYKGDQSVAWADGSHEPFGLEKRIEDYIAHSIEVLRAIRRVLKPWGVVWWNLDDGMSESGRGGGGKQQSNRGSIRGPYSVNGLPPLNLCLIPERFVIAAQEDGWIVRSRIVWAKPSPMPESVRGWFWTKCRVKAGNHPAKQDSHPGSDSLPEGRHGQGTPEWADCPGCEKCEKNGGLVLRKGNWRPSESYESIFMLAAGPGYYGDGESVREPNTEGTMERARHANPGWLGEKTANREGKPVFGPGILSAGHGRNLRNVWILPPEGYDGPHYAVFPSSLPKRCILASTSDKGNCVRCGMPWVRVLKPSEEYQERLDQTGEKWYTRLGHDGYGDKFSVSAEYLTLSWRPSCNCGCEETVPPVVLDPFVGTGTTVAVAKSLGRKGIGVDMSSDYLALAQARIEAVTARLV